VDKSKTIAVSLGIMALVVGGFNTFTISDEEIQQYIASALSNGCKPAIDLCSSDCKSKNIVAEVSPQCIPKEIMRVDYRRAQDNYINLAKNLGIKDTGNFEKLPTLIREKLEKDGIILQAVKEDLSE